MNTKQLLVALCALGSVPAIQALTITVYNATNYSATMNAGRVAATTVQKIASPQSKVTMELGGHTMDSCYAYVTIPNTATGLDTTKETLRHYSAPGGQAFYKEFVLYGPVDGEFYLCRPVF